MNVCTYRYIYLFVYIYIYIVVCICTYIHMYLNTCLHILIHTPWTPSSFTGLDAHFRRFYSMHPPPTSWHEHLTLSTNPWNWTTNTLLAARHLNPRTHLLPAHERFTMTHTCSTWFHKPTFRASTINNINPRTFDIHLRILEHIVSLQPAHYTQN